MRVPVLAVVLFLCGCGSGGTGGGAGGGTAGGAGGGTAGGAGGGTAGGAGGGTAGGAGGGTAGGVGGGTAGGAGGGTAGGVGGGSADAGPQVPLIGSVLTCGTLGAAGGLGPGTDLARYNFSATEFPDALCNDGTPAFLYYRPASTVGSRNRWLIFLQGGGSCDSPAQCAERWCSVNTAFGMQGMSATPAPAAINANGILERRVDNPMGTWNHVLIKYCSSDMWSGTRRDVVVNTPDPVDGGPRQFRMHALGARIFDAAIVKLRSDAGSTLPSMPDLDEADVVVLAGASGGGAGTINNLDRLRTVLRATNVACQGASCPLVVRGMIDSIFAPSFEALDYSTTSGCDSGICSYATQRAYVELAGSAVLWGRRGDDSCATWHAANAPDSGFSCNDPGHVVRNHLTTPFLVRQGQTDSLIASNVISAGFTVPDAGLINLVSFAALVRSDLRALANLQATAEEGAAITTVPATFGPTCSKHETFTDTPSVFQVFIDAGTPTRLLDVAGNWFLGTGPISAIANAPSDNYCPP